MFAVQVQGVMLVPPLLSLLDDTQRVVTVRKVTKCSLKLFECSLKFTECSLEFTECSLELT